MTEPTRAHLIALLHRSHTMLRYLDEMPLDELRGRHALIADIAEVLPAVPKRTTGTCWCGEPAVDRLGLHCNEHSEFQLGEG